MEIQRAMTKRSAEIPEERRIEFRIGINVGDIIIDEGDIYGDGVNIAARLETLASPGAICLSDHAYQQIKGKLALEVSDMGEQQLKNIAQPVRVYGVRLDDAATRPALSLPDRPSIAVLAFQNMSGDPDQEYFADGMVEDIITALSRMPRLFVIARNSSFTFKGRLVDVKHVGRELGVRYVLEGSVRKAGTRVRITGQLIDASTGMHLWADRFEGALEDILDLQDQVTMSVVGAIAPQLEQAEIERAKHKPTESLDAYDYFLRGMASYYRRTREAINEALPLGDRPRALVLNPNLAGAWYTSGWVRVFLGESDVAIKHFAQAMRLSPLDPHTIGMQAGTAFAHFLAGRFDEASLWAGKAMWENTNYLTTIIIAAASNALAGRPAEAQKIMVRLRELAPTLRVSNVKDWAAFRRPEDLAKLEEGLWKAGLPE
jgi:TolB-like protein